MEKIRLSRKFIDAARRMPELPHASGSVFDIQKSEAAKWLCSQPGIMQYVFDKANGNGLIEFDAERGTWQGVDHGLA